MSKIDELIQQYCPNGVEYVELQQAFDIRNGYTPSKNVKDFWENGTIPWFRMDDIRTNGRILSTALQYISSIALKGSGLFPKDSIIIATSATIGEHALITVPFLCNQRFTCLSCTQQYKQRINIKFFFYYAYVIDKWCCNNTNAGGFASVDIAKLKKITIPVPPLPVQEEIVRILDKFTELEARRRQYEYYRNKLLDFNELQRYSGGVKLMTLGSFCEIGTGRSNRDDAIANGSYPFYVRSKDVFRNNEYEFDDKEAVIIPGEGGIGEIFHYAKGKYALHQRAYRISPKMEGISGKYLYYFLMVHFRNFIQKRAVSATVTSIRKPMLEDFEIAILPLPEQERIVTILDRFDALVNDLSSGLPGELDARRRQYEYYRDRLLSFPPAV